MPSDNASNEDAASSYEIGPRGLLILESPETYRYYADNEEVTWTQFPVSLETLETQRKVPRHAVEVLTAARSPIAVCSEDPRTFLVNLDAFQSLPAADSRPRLTPRAPHLGTEGDVYLIHENGRYYAVIEEELESLDFADATYAQALVKRGAVAAALPKNSIPIGTHCVLINLPELLPQEALAESVERFGSVEAAATEACAD